MKRVIPVLLALALIAAGYYWYTTRSNGNLFSTSGPGASERIFGSGSIEADIVAITAEIEGRIVAMYADEGDEVKQGDLLVTLDTSLLEAQRNQLQAGLDTAQANLAEVKSPPRPEDVAAAEAQLRQAQAARRGAFTVWQQALALARNPLDLNVEVENARGQVAVLQKEVESAQADLKKATIQRDEAARNQLNNEAIVMSQVAELGVKAAQANLAASEAELAGGQRQLALFIAMRDNPVALITQAHAAESAYMQGAAAAQLAQAQLALVRAGPLPEEIAIADAQVEQAQAAVEHVQVQVDKMSLTAPRNGVITNRAVNPGELAAPGNILLEVGDLDKVKLTVYVPETQIGQVQVGQTGQVNVDAYPNETFEGCVTYISPEAEFTPKNVQTKEERVNLVFAVKISLANPAHRLKPGMPADAEILIDTSGCTVP
jgi:HlyD family secretion protein